MTSLLGALKQILIEGHPVCMDTVRGMMDLVMREKVGVNNQLPGRLEGIILEMGKEDYLLHEFAGFSEAQGLTPFSEAELYNQFGETLSKEVK